MVKRGPGRSITDEPTGESTDTTSDESDGSDSSSEDDSGSNGGSSRYGNRRPQNTPDVDDDGGSGGSDSTDTDDSGSESDDFEQDQRQSRRVGGSGDPDDEPTNDTGGDDSSQDESSGSTDPTDTEGQSDDFEQDQRQSRRVGGSGEPTDEPGDPGEPGSDYQQDQRQSQRLGGSGDPDEGVQGPSDPQSDYQQDRQASRRVGGQSDQSYRVGETTGNEEQDQRIARNLEDEIEQQADVTDANVVASDGDFLVEVDRSIDPSRRREEQINEALSQLDGRSRSERVEDRIIDQNENIQEGDIEVEEREAAPGAPDAVRRNIEEDPYRVEFTDQGELRQAQAQASELEAENPGLEFGVVQQDGEYQVQREETFGGDGAVESILRDTSSAYSDTVGDAAAEFGRSDIGQALMQHPASTVLDATGVSDSETQEAKDTAYSTAARNVAEIGNLPQYGVTGIEAAEVGGYAAREVSEGAIEGAEQGLEEDGASGAAEGAVEGYGQASVEVGQTVTDVGVSTGEMAVDYYQDNPAEAAGTAAAAAASIPLGAGAARGASAISPTAGRAVTAAMDPGRTTVRAVRSGIPDRPSGASRGQLNLVDALPSSNRGDSGEATITADDLDVSRSEPRQARLGPRVDPDAGESPSRRQGQRLTPDGDAEPSPTFREPQEADISQPGRPEPETMPQRIDTDGPSGTRAQNQRLVNEELTRQQRAQGQRIESDPVDEPQFRRPREDTSVQTDTDARVQGELARQAESESPTVRSPDRAASGRGRELLGGGVAGLAGLSGSANALDENVGSTDLLGNVQGQDQPQEIGTAQPTATETAVDLNTELSTATETPTTFGSDTGTPTDLTTETGAPTRTPTPNRIGREGEPRPPRSPDIDLDISADDTPEQSGGSLGGSEDEIIQRLENPLGGFGG